MQSQAEPSRRAGARHRFALHPTTACLLLALSLLLTGLNLHRFDEDWGCWGWPCRWLGLKASRSVELWGYDFGRLFVDILVWLTSLLGSASILEDRILGSRFGAVTQGPRARFQFSLLTGLATMVVAAVLLWCVVDLNDVSVPSALYVVQTRGWPFTWFCDSTIGPRLRDWRELAADVCICLSILCLVLLSCEGSLMFGRGTRHH